MCVTENPPKKKPRTHFNIDMRRPVFIAAVGCRMVYLPSLMCPKSGLCAAEQDIYYFLPSTPLLLFIHRLSLSPSICYLFILYQKSKCQLNYFNSSLCCNILHRMCVCDLCFGLLSQLAWIVQDYRRSLLRQMHKRKKLSDFIFIVQSSLIGE